MATAKRFTPKPRPAMIRLNLTQTEAEALRTLLYAGVVGPYNHPSRLALNQIEAALRKANVSESATMICDEVAIVYDLGGPDCVGQSYPKQFPDGHSARF